MKRLVNILLLLLVSLSIVGCDATIHEYPDSRKWKYQVPFALSLEFDTNMPIYQQIEHMTRNSLTGDDLDLRYIIKVYEATQWEGEIDEELLVDTFVCSKSDVAEWNYQTELELENGEYDIVVWADYVDAGTTNHKYYNADNFSYIFNTGAIPNDRLGTIAPDEDYPYSGSNDFRDAFVGRTRVKLDKESVGSTVVIPMERPLAKYRFIASDLESFISRMETMKKKQMEESRGDDDTKVDTKVTIDLNDYYVVFSYNSYVNTSFHALMNAPISNQNISFKSTIRKLNKAEAEIGFDYVFVNGSKASVFVWLDVYDKDGTWVGGVNQFSVPLLRSHLTEVRGTFLTLQESGGVGISPGFDDEFTMEIN
ncbi:MAG: FimB/Mfa2 family fimbrial subunit [Alistipes sp.]|nr:FimB/Mfa2 family fimbrial subunit [Alistipes sp.]